MLHTRKPMTDEAVAAMAARNEQRRVIAKRVLGDKHITSEANRVLSKRQRDSTARIELRPYQINLAEFIKRNTPDRIVFIG